MVVAVRENPKVGDLDLLNGQLRIKNIPWTMLTYLDGELDGGVPEGIIFSRPW